MKGVCQSEGHRKIAKPSITETVNKAPVSFTFSLKVFSLIGVSFFGQARHVEMNELSQVKSQVNLHVHCYVEPTSALLWHNN